MPPPSASSGSSTTAPRIAATSRWSGSSVAGPTSCSSTFPCTRAGSTRSRSSSSIIQRKVLQPNDFAHLAVLARTLNEFEHHYNEVAEPVDWRFTRADLAQLQTRLARHEPALQLAS